MPSSPVLSETDKTALKKILKELCEHRWTTDGYKKTNVKELCASAEIGIGTFYGLYAKKEDLFLETIEDIRERLKIRFLGTCQHNPNKEGFAQAFKGMIREYAAVPFLYDVNKPDYQAFVTKLSVEAMEKIRFDSISFFRKAADCANLHLKIGESEAYGALSALLATIYVKEILSVTCDYFSVFDFMADNLIQSIFK